KLLAQGGALLKGARVGVLGLTFKENVSDLRNSRVPDIVRELLDFGVQVLVHDPLAPADSARELYAVELSSWEQLRELDALVLAVPHAEYRRRPVDELLRPLRAGGIVIDVRSMLHPRELPSGLRYWSL